MDDKRLDEVMEKIRPLVGKSIELAEEIRSLSASFKPIDELNDILVGCMDEIGDIIKGTQVCGEVTIIGRIEPSTDERFVLRTKRDMTMCSCVLIPVEYTGGKRPQMFMLVEKVDEDGYIYRAFVEGVNIINAIPKGTRLMTTSPMFAH